MYLSLYCWLPRSVISGVVSGSDSCLLTLVSNGSVSMSQFHWSQNLDLAWVAWGWGTLLPGNIFGADIQPQSKPLYKNKGEIYPAGKINLNAYRETERPDTAASFSRGESLKRLTSWLIYEQRRAGSDCWRGNRLRPVSWNPGASQSPEWPFAIRKSDYLSKEQVPNSEK